jgi:hypothetical protein
MKAILILIVTAGTIQGSSLGPDQTLQVREIEFSNMASCRQAAEQLTKSARRADERSRIFIDTTTDRVLVPAPVVIAECVST